MTTDLGSAVQEPVALILLHKGDAIHVGPHDVWRHSSSPHAVNCTDADVRFDCLIIAGDLFVVCWHIPACEENRPPVTGATTYDADDSVLREVVAA
jgi:hypothetical protein